MSVSTFIKQCFESDLDFSNTNVDDFIVCVRRLSQILKSASDDSRKSTRDRKMNSVLARQVFLSERFNPKTVHDYYSFTMENEQIDICIKSSTFCVSVCGDYVPTAKQVMNVLNLDNENEQLMFDFADISTFSWSDSKFTYFGGATTYFDLTDKGLQRIKRVFSCIVQMYLSHLKIYV